MQVLITGGAGFIGSHLAEYHLKQGDKVCVVDDLSTGSGKNISNLKKNNNFKFIQQNILTWRKLDQAIKSSQRVYHLASVVGVHQVIHFPLKVLHTNILGCERILRIISELKKPPQLIVTSTSEVYGLNNELLSENSRFILESSTKSRWTYSISKISEESLAIAYQKTFKLPILIVRPFNTIGPRQSARYGMVVPRFIKQALNNEPITIFGNGKQTRSFCDVRDLVVILNLIANNIKSYGQVINIGNAQEISIKNLALLIKKITHSHSKLKYLSYKKAYGEDFEDVVRRRPNLKKLKSFINVKYQWSLKSTLNDLIVIQRKLNRGIKND